ncbi:hypothetical protein [Nocardia aurea]|uniref:Uncharacterized protein n=1 Tax=Nocardia aurea TaxID=2144174 RepID=A0ABV3FPN0_9NOCA
MFVAEDRGVRGISLPDDLDQAGSQNIEPCDLSLGRSEPLIGHDRSVTAPLPEQFMSRPVVLSVALIFPFGRRNLVARTSQRLMGSAVLTVLAAFDFLFHHQIQDRSGVSATSQFGYQEPGCGGEEYDVVGLEPRNIRVEVGRSAADQLGRSSYAFRPLAR